MVGHFVKLLCTLLLSSFVAATAWAVPLTWSINGTFDDGGTVSGSYVFDATANVYSSIDVTTTNGTTRAGAHYTLQNPCCGTSSIFLLFVTTTGDLTDTPVFSSYLQTAMTDLGGTIALDIGGPFYSEESCSGAACGGPAPPERHLVSGFVTTNPVSEPGTMLLIAGGMLAAVGMRRRKVHSA